MFTQADLAAGLEAINRVPPTAGELAFFTSNFSTLDEAFEFAITGATDVRKAIAFYQVFYNRVPDSAGLDFWAGIVRSGFSDEELGQAFFDAGEFTDLYGGLSVENMVLALYRNVLGREADGPGFAFWVDQVKNQGLSLAELGRRFATSDETMERFGPNIDEFLSDAANGEEAYQGSLFDDAAEPGVTITPADGVSEGDPAGTVVASISASHADDDETPDVTVSDGFAVDGNNIVTTGPVGSGDLTLDVSVSAGGNTVSQSSTVSVTSTPPPPGDTGQLGSYASIQALASDGNEALNGDGGDNAFTGSVGFGDDVSGLPSNLGQRTANAGDVLNAGGGNDAFFLTRAENDLDDGIAQITGVSGLGVEVVSVSNRDEEDSEFFFDNDLFPLSPSQQFGYSAFFWEDNGPDIPRSFVFGDDPNINTLGRTNKLNAFGIPVENNGNTEEFAGIYFNYYNDGYFAGTDGFGNPVDRRFLDDLAEVEFSSDCKVAVPELPLTKAIDLENPDWTLIELEQFEALEELYAQDSVNGILFTDVQESFWNTQRKLTIEDVKADMVLLDSDLQANTGQALNLELNEASLSHFVMTSNFEFEANRGDQISSVDIVATGKPSVIGNIQNGVTDALFLAGERGQALAAGLENTGYSSATTSITVNADEMSLALPQPDPDGEFPDGQLSNLQFPDRELCLNPGLRDQFDLMLGTNVGLGDRLPGLTTFDASASVGDVLAVFAKPNISTIKFGSGADYAIFDELGENGSTQNLRGVNLDMGEDTDDGSDPNDGDIDTLGVFSDDMATLHVNGSTYNNVEVLTALEAVGYGDDKRPLDSPDDIGPNDDPDLSDGNANGRKDVDYEGSLFNNNVFDDTPNTAADNISPIGSNDPFLVDMSTFDGDGDADLAYLHFAHGVDSDIRAQDFAVDEFTIQFDQKCWEVNVTANQNGFAAPLNATPTGPMPFTYPGGIPHSSGANTWDNGGLPGSYLASILEEGGTPPSMDDSYDLELVSDALLPAQIPGIYEGFDVEIGSDRVVDERVNLYFNIRDINPGRELAQVWNGINEEDIDGTPSQVQSITDQYFDHETGTTRFNDVATMHLHMENGGGDTDMFVDNIRMRNLDTLYLSSDRDNRGSMRVETGTFGNTSMLTLVDGSRLWDVDPTVPRVACSLDGIVASDGENIAFKDDNADQLLARLAECSCFEEDKFVTDRFLLPNLAVENLLPAYTVNVNNQWNVQFYELGYDWLRVSDQGADILLGQGNDVATGGAGDDRLLGFEGNDILLGGGGNDGLFGGAGFDTLQGGDGNDYIVTGGGIGSGDNGDDVLIGGDGVNDTLFGGNGNDFLAGLGADDRLAGGNEDDILLGGAGNDVVVGEGGRDLVSGDIGSDVLVGDSYVAGLCEDRIEREFTPSDVNTIQDHLTDNCPCIKITLTGHDALGNNPGSLVGDGDLFRVSFIGPDGLPKSAQVLTTIGQTVEQVADLLAAEIQTVLTNEFGGGFVVTTPGNMIEIKPASGDVVLPVVFDQFGHPDDTHAQDGFGPDIAGAPDTALVTIQDAPYDVGDEIEVEVTVGATVYTASYTVGTTTPGTVPVDPTSPLNAQAGDINTDDATPTSVETAAEIAAGVEAAIAAAIAASGITTTVTGNQIRFTGPDNATNFNVTASTIDTDMSNYYGVETDALDENDTLDTTITVNGNPVRIRAYVDPDTGDIGYEINNTGFVPGGTTYNDVNQGTTDLLNAFARGIETAINGIDAGAAMIYDEANLGPVDWSIAIAVDGDTEITGLDNVLIREGISVDFDLAGTDESLLRDNADPAVANGAPLGPRQAEEFITVDYCLDPPDVDQFVVRSQAGAENGANRTIASNYADGWDNDYVPVDFSGIVRDMSTTAGYYTGDAFYTNIVKNWLADPFLQPQQVRDGDLPNTVPDTQDGVRGVDFAVDFHSIDTVRDGFGGEADKLIFRNQFGEFSANGAATNYAEFHQAASNRDDADADAFNAFAANDQLRYVAISNDGIDGGDNFLRVYYNDETSADATPDAVIELVGLNNALNQFHYQDIEALYDETHFVDPLKGDDYLI